MSAEEEDFAPRWPPVMPKLEDTPDPLWMEQLNQNMLMTVRALQRLHKAFDAKFTGAPPL